MDGFSYVNLFDTKGIEYLIIIAFLLMIIPFWKILNRPLKAGVRRLSAERSLFDRVAAVPQGLYFSNSHTWAHLLRSGEARIGVDSLITSLTGGVSLKMLKEPGNSINKGEQITELVRDGKRLSLVSPVSGTLTGFNDTVLSDPYLLREDPYGEGWIFSVRPANWISEVKAFHVAEDATAWLRNELQKTRDFLAFAGSRVRTEPDKVYMQDGGEPANESLASMPGEVWEEFQKQFLK